MEGFERKTDKIGLNIKEVMRSTLQQEKNRTKSSFLCVSETRSSTVKLPFRDDEKFHVEIDDIDF